MSRLFAALCASALLLPAVLPGQAVWRAGPKPTLQLPALTESGETRFSLITAATQLSNGDVVVADGGAFSLIVLAPSGEVKRRVGRQGAGPGEFQAIWWMGRCGGDTIAVHDPTGRISYFSPAGEFIRQQVITDPVGVMRCGGSGRLAMLALDAPKLPESGKFRPTTTLLTSRTTEAPRAIRNGVPGPEFYIIRKQPIPDALGRQTVIGTLGNDLLLGTGDSNMVERIAPDGRTVGVIRWNQARILATDKDKALATEAYLTIIPVPSQKDLGDLMDQIPKPEWLPPYFGMWVTSSEEIWILTTPSGSNPARFVVLSPKGAMTATLSIPLSVTVLDVSPSSIVASTEDADGELTLITLPIQR